MPASSLADIKFALENPASGQVLSGIRVISGWAFSTESAEPVSVRLWIDDGEAIEVPCCVERADVANGHPDYPQALNSGFGQVFNAGLLEKGAHTLTIEFEDATGARETRAQRIETVKPGGFEFLGSLDLDRADAELSEDKQEIFITGVIVRETGSTESEEIELRLAWQENLQALGIVAARNENEPIASTAAALSASLEAVEMRAEDPVVEPVQVSAEELTVEPDRVQHPAIIRIDPNSGNRTILSDVHTPTRQDLSGAETEGDETLTDPGPTWLIPQGLTIEPNGQIAVTDAGREALIRVDPVTGRRQAFAGSGSSLVRPNGVAAYPQESGLDRTLVIADSGRSGVYELNGSRTIISNREFEDEPEQVDLKDPFGIAVESSCTEDDCRVVVADAGLRAIVRLDRRTEERTIISDEGWMTPVDIDVAADGQLFVVDVGLNAIVRVDPTNGSRAIVSGAGTGDGPAFQRVRALAIEPDGRLAVVDEGARTVLRVDPRSGERRIISGPETGDGPELRVPVDIAVASDGQLIVVDSAPFSAVFENPFGDFVGGIGLVSGWAFANVSAATLNSVVLTIDDNAPMPVPWGASRGDVQASFPERPWAAESGFGLVTNFNILPSGSHTFALTVEDTSGSSHTLSRNVETVRLGNSEFLDRFDMTNAEVDIFDDTVSIEQVEIRDKASQLSREINASFVWRQSCQCFVVQGECGNGNIESNEECDGQTFGGQTCQSLGFDGGDLSCTEQCNLDLNQCTGGMPVLVANSGDDSVSLVSAATHEEVGTIQVGDNPRSIAVSPTQTLAYVTNFGDGTVSVLDLTDLTALTDPASDLPTIDVGHDPVGLAFRPDGRYAYAVNAGQNRVSVINTDSHTIETHIRVGSEPQEIAINAAGTRAYVTNSGDGTVSVIDLATNEQLTTIAVGEEPNGVAVRPGGREVYVVNSQQDDNTVSIIDTRTNRVVATLTREEDEGRIGLVPQKVTFSPDGRKAFVTNSLDDTVSIIDAATRANLDTPYVRRYRYRTVYDQPNGILVTPNGLRFYVSLFGRSGQGDYLAIFSVKNDHPQYGLIGFVEVGEGPIGLAGGPG
ncbi:MAG: beta-propeller fold lactonase family protein [Desulfurellaceae bacterium]|nr:beta-propeller fold lactonase family protein [Desulfurellaceae bacterium]